MTTLVCPILCEVIPSNKAFRLGKQIYNVDGLWGWAIECMRKGIPVTCPMTRRIVSASDMSAIQLMVEGADSPVHGHHYAWMNNTPGGGSMLDSDDDDIPPHPPILMRSMAMGSMQIRRMLRTAGTPTPQHIIQ